VIWAAICDESSAAGKFQGQATRVDGSALGRAYRTDLVMGESFLQSGVRFGIVKCQLTERRFQFPDCRARRMLEGAEGDQRNTVTAVAFGLKQIIAAVYRLRDCRFCLRLAGCRYPRVGFQPGWPSLACKPESLRLRRKLLHRGRCPADSRAPALSPTRNTRRKPSNGTFAATHSRVGAASLLRSKGGHG